ncbi:MAG: hypothetical protein IJV76_00320 [Clostridia bacterium]|nr:hypothetical protein [Clostridia bacterium]
MPRPKGSGNVGPAVRHCHRCGREIIGYTDEWAYRREFRMAGRAKSQEHVFCTWSCLCAAQREADEQYGVKPDKYEQVYENLRKRQRMRYERLKKKKA